jgi:hypothetical protein
MSNIFPYPLPETLGIGDVDPMDYRYENGKAILEPGWWMNIKVPEKKIMKKNNKKKRR